MSKFSDEVEQLCGRLDSLISKMDKKIEELEKRENATILDHPPSEIEQVVRGK